MDTCTQSSSARPMALTLGKPPSRSRMATAISRASSISSLTRLTLYAIGAGRGMQAPGAFVGRPPRIGEDGLAQALELPTAHVRQVLMLGATGRVLVEI